VYHIALSLVPGMGNTSPKDMDSLLPLMNMVIYCIDKVKKLRLNREVSRRRGRSYAVWQRSTPCWGRVGVKSLVSLVV